MCWCSRCIISSETSGRSGVIGHEFAFFYNVFCRGEVPSAKPILLQYADYAVWQRRCLTDDWLSTQSKYWQKKLAGLSKLSLPTDYPRPVTQTFNGSHRMLELPTSLIERLKQFSAEHNATVFMTLLACFQIFLIRYSGQTDVAVGSPIANRTQSAVESIIGSFVNTLVMRTDLSGDPTFIELMARVRETALEAYANQDFPFDKLVEMMHSTRDQSSAPLVQVLFNVPNAPIREINVQGLSWVPFEVETQAAQFDLSLTIETEFSRKAYLTFNTDLFEAQTAERMLGQYKILLQSALANPQSRLSELPTLTTSERKQILQDWNRTQRDYPAAECFPQLFEAQVERMPDAIALSMGQKTLRYSQLNTQANQLARYLQTQGARPGTAVGIGLERSVEMVIALLAVLKTGAAYVPLDPDYPRDRLRFMSENASLIAVLTSASLSDRFDAQVCRTLCLDREQRTDRTGARPQSSTYRHASGFGVHPVYIGVDRTAERSGNSAQSAGELLMFDTTRTRMFRSRCHAIGYDNLLRYRRLGNLCAVAGRGPCRDCQPGCRDGRTTTTEPL